ncbi:MAG TPA: helix-turn-helix transcriptional regulator [Elusimicrobiales bacterium]|nr:helix-turn-helix transcriptional regulator [Elusimicrobiales bacterium]
MQKKFSKSDRYLVKSIGKNIRKYRKKEGFSQETLAFNAHLDRNYIGAVERGEANISAISLNKIAKALNIPAVKFWEF